MGPPEIRIHPISTASIRRVVETRILNGGAGRSRTDDPLLAKQMLFQLSYGPCKECGCVVDPHETGKEQLSSEILLCTINRNDN